MTRLVPQLARAALLLGLLHVAAAPARAAVLLVQDFDDITTLAADGWEMVNNSAAGGSTGWFQGNTGVFPAQAGAPDSYVAANFLNAGAGAISNWLILPELAFFGDATLSFFTRSAGDLPDRLEVRFSAGGGADVGITEASVGSFTTLFLTLNPALTPDGYPSDWTQFVVSLAPVNGLSGRLAFRYLIDDNLTNGDYIGIDSVSVVSTVPEPGTLSLLALGAAGVLAGRRRSARQSDAAVQKEM